MLLVLGLQRVGVVCCNKLHSSAQGAHIDLLSACIRQSSTPSPDFSRREYSYQFLYQAVQIQILMSSLYCDSRAVFAGFTHSSSYKAAGVSRINCLSGPAVKIRYVAPSGASTGILCIDLLLLKCDLNIGRPIIGFLPSVSNKRYFIQIWYTINIRNVCLQSISTQSKHVKSIDSTL